MGVLLARLTSHTGHRGGEEEGEKKVEGLNENDVLGDQVLIEIQWEGG